ncbi:MAG: MOSC domain-containing protein [Pseudomonadota bacterium]
MKEFQIVSINISKTKGEKKKPVAEVELKVDLGLVGDGHAGLWHRQVSLLGTESIAKIQAKGLAVNPGDFAENITTEGIELFSLPIGTRLKLGKQAEVEITQIGKKCHQGCAILKQTGDCVMPREGVFAKVVKSGKLMKGAVGKIL